MQVLSKCHSIIYLFDFLKCQTFSISTQLYNGLLVCKVYKSALFPDVSFRLTVVFSQLKPGKNLYLIISGYVHFRFTHILLSVLSQGQYSSDTFLLPFLYFHLIILVF